MKLALLIVWGGIAAFCGIGFYVLGTDGFIIAIWPTIFGVFFTRRMFKVARDYGISPANEPREPRK